jgi:ELWxxDGT repeat protein
LHQFAGQGDRVFVSASTPATGRELHMLDANDQVTLVADIRGGPVGASIDDIVALDDRIVFDADDGVFGTELWASTGTAQGTIRLTDLNVGVGSSDPRDFAREGGRIFFTALDPAVGRELYVTDGTIAGTRRVTDLFAGVGGAFGNYDARMTAANGRVYFRATSSSEPGCVLFESDGTAAGTHCAYNAASIALGPVQEFVIAANGAIVFGAWRAADGEEPRVLFNRNLVAVTGGDIAPGPIGSAPQAFKAAGNDVYFRADDGATGAELWRLSLGDLDTLFNNGFE